VEHTASVQGIATQGNSLTQLSRLGDIDQAASLLPLQLERELHSAN